MSKLGVVVLSAALSLAASGSVSSNQLSPVGSAREIQLERLHVSFFAKGEILLYRYGVGLFMSPVHEEITSRIWGCETVACDDVDKSDVPPAVLAGVRWNDDPRFPLTKVQAQGTSCNIDESIRVATQPRCWGELFKRAERGAAAGKSYGPGDPFVYRTHFGDLQFLHAMASKEGELASETQRKMLDWAEFTWRVASGEFTLETRLKTINIPTIQQRFGMTDWRVSDLLTLGNSGIRSNLREVAFGSLLHMLQDSFAAGHVDREESTGAQICRSGDLESVAPGAIREFHAYNHQDHKAHANADSREAFLQQLELPGNVVVVGRTLRQYFDRQEHWEVVKPFLQCVFAIRDVNHPSSSGEAFSIK